MILYQLGDFAINVLGPQEASQAEETIRGEFLGRKAKMEKIKFKFSAGIADGWEIFSSAPENSQHICNLPSNLRRAHTLPFVNAIDTLILHDPFFFELHYLNGRNLVEITTAQSRENFLRIRRGERNPGCERFFDFYSEKAESYLKNGISFFQEYAREKPDSLRIHSTRMIAYLASCYRARALDSVQVKATDGWTTDLFSSIKELSEKAISVYEGVLRDGVFVDPEGGAKVLASLANSLKLQTTPANVERGLRYYQTAAGVLGPHPMIMEGIEWFEEIKKKTNSV